MKLEDLNDDQYGLLFDVCRSVRYHDRRRAFFEGMHQLTCFLTVLMAGSVLFDLGKAGETAGWLYLLSVSAALLAASDMVIGYSRCATRHSGLRERFSDLQIALEEGDLSESSWRTYRLSRLRIEKDEPPVFKIVDLLCHNELLTAFGFDRAKQSGEFIEINCWQRLTSHLWRWENWQPKREILAATAFPEPE
jgi:hypothetical protein